MGGDWLVPQAGFPLNCPHVASVSLRIRVCTALWSLGAMSVSFLMFPQRIAGITAMLQQSLEGLLLEGLQTSDVDIVRHCLRTYATIDKTQDAEALVGQVLVKPYVNEVCVAGVRGRAGYTRDARSTCLRGSCSQLVTAGTECTLMDVPGTAWRCLQLCC